MLRCEFRKLNLSTLHRGPIDISLIIILNPVFVQQPLQITNFSLQFIYQGIFHYYKK